MTGKTHTTVSGLHVDRHQRAGKGLCVGAGRVTCHVPSLQEDSMKETPEMETRFKLAATSSAIGQWPIFFVTSL